VTVYLGYPLLCDTTEEVLADLRIPHEEKDGIQKVLQRSMFIIDGNHEIRWRWITDNNWNA
jgi:peroxiredoxin